MNTVPTVQFQNKILKSKFLFWPLLHCRQLNHVLRRLVPAIHILFFNVCYNTILFVFHVTGHSVVFVVEGTWVYALDFGGSDGKRLGLMPYLVDELGGTWVCALDLVDGMGSVWVYALDVGGWDEKPMCLCLRFWGLGWEASGSMLRLRF